MRMIRWISGDRLQSAEPRYRIDTGIEDIRTVLERKRLRWLGICKENMLRTV